VLYLTLLPGGSSKSARGVTRALDASFLRAAFVDAAPIEPSVSTRTCVQRGIDQAERQTTGRPARKMGESARMDEIVVGLSLTLVHTRAPTHMCTSPPPAKRHTATIDDRSPFARDVFSATSSVMSIAWVEAPPDDPAGGDPDAWMRRFAAIETRASTPTDVARQRYEEHIQPQPRHRVVYTQSGLFRQKPSN